MSDPNPDVDAIYNLVPRYYRQRDFEQGHPLEAFLAVIERERQSFKQEIFTLYDNWFIETCDESIIPYIADLIGVETIAEEWPLNYSRRTQIANTIRARRTKGTVGTITMMAKAVTGWHCYVVEYQERTAKTTTMRYPGAGLGRNVDIRRMNNAPNARSPFDTNAHTVDLRSISQPDPESQIHQDTTQGRYNLFNLGIFVWRLQVYPIAQQQPRRQTLPDVDRQPSGRHHAHASVRKTEYYTFNPFGHDTQLFNLPQRDVARTNQNAVPAPLAPGDLTAEIVALRNKTTAPSEYLGQQGAVLQILVLHQNQWMPVEPIHWTIADLSNPSQWTFPTAQNAQQDTDQDIRVVVDPHLGRFILKDMLSEVRVNYVYAFSADLGGGPYTRPLPLLAPDPNSFTECTVGRSGDYPNLQEALANNPFSEQYPGYRIRLIDNATLTLPADLTISLSSGQWIEIEADDGCRPFLVGNLQVTAYSGSRLALIGVWLDGQVRTTGPLKLIVDHCTLKPGSPDGGIVESEESPGLMVIVTHSLVGPIRLSSRGSSLLVRDSLVDGGSTHSVTGHGLNLPGIEHQYGPMMAAERSTFFGEVVVAEMLATDVIFLRPLRVQRAQSGFLRFCYVPPASTTPIRYRCQPDIATHKQTEPQKQFTHNRIEPDFTARQFGHPGYGQLSRQCAIEIRTGAHNGAEMGTFNSLYQAQRERALLKTLEEFMPFGLQAGVFYET